MRFGILGPVQVRDAAGRDVPVGGPGVRALLGRLLVDAGRLVGTDRLVADLYADHALAGAANALQSQVSRLRRALPADTPLEGHPAGYRLAVSPEEVDAHQFRQLAEAGRAALAAGAPARAAPLLQEALDQWRGPALADVTAAPYAAAEASRLEELRLAAAEDHAEARLRLGGGAALVPDLRELVRDHPLRERACGQLMRALYAGGRQAEALDVFEAVRRRLAEEFGADPSPALADTHLAILRGEPDPGLTPPGQAPVPQADGERPPSATGAAPHRPPGQLTSFLGRDEELARVGKLLAEARLVTLTGPGGAGKTRLAIEAASRQEVETCFVDLAPLTDGADVAPTVSAALGLRDASLRVPPGGDAAGGGPDPVARLTAALAERRLLLLWDNCEHVVAAAAALADRLLAACPRLVLLTTSREPLGLIGEARCPVSGLALPPPEAPPEQVREYAAVRLFADRAGRATPDSVLDDMDTVGRVCRALDGLPLAIELAAARLRSLPLPELAARLDDRFTLLSRGSRVVQARHRTLRAVIEWSWDLLDTDEQALARRLTVFTGGATSAAVEQVCRSSVEVLSDLVDKSLVEVDGGRYRMLETVRAYGAEQLTAAGEAERLRAAHAAYFLELARTADAHLRGVGQLEWLARLDDERENLHAAVRGAATAGDAGTGVALVTALAFYWWLRGLRREAAALAAEVLAVAGATPPAGAEDEHAVCVLLATLRGRGDPERHRRLRQASAIVHELDRPPRQPFLYYLSAMVAGPPAGGPDAVLDMQAQVDNAQHGAARGASDGEPWLQALSPLGLAMVRALSGQLPEAERDAEVSLARFRRLGDHWGTMIALGNLSEIVAERGESARAAELLGEALRLATELGSRIDAADMLRTRGDGRLQAGDVTAAGEDYRQAVELARQAGAPEVLAAAHLGLAAVAWRGGDTVEARRLAEVALAECPTGWFGAEETRAAAQRLLADLTGGAGHASGAGGADGTPAG